MTFDDGLDPETWRADAALCNGYHNALWYPPVDPSVPSHTDVGKMVCERCTAWKRCLHEGMDERWGIWGGLSPSEREAIGKPHSHNDIGARHGTIVRYRQGCRCSACVAKEEEKRPFINMAVLPRPLDVLPPPALLKVMVRKSSN